MTDQELTAAQDRLIAINTRDREIKHALDEADAVVKEQRAKIVNLSAERARLKAEYGPLYDQVGVELKARRAAEAAKQKAE